MASHEFSEEDSDLVRRSYGRAMTARELIPRFYELFMAKAPDVRTKFAGTDFDTQNVLLLDSISMAMSDGYEADS